MLSAHARHVTATGGHRRCGRRQIAAAFMGPFERRIISTLARSQPMERSRQSGTSRAATRATSSCAVEMSLILMTPIKPWLSMTGRCRMRFLFMR